MWFLRDPLQLSERQIFFPQTMAPLLPLLDGEHTRSEIHSAFCNVVGTSLEPEVTESAIDQLAEAFLLENEQTELARAGRLEAYRAAPFRIPLLAGNGYPADPAALSKHLSSYDDGDKAAPWNGRGIVSPHIDYQRGGDVYAKVWNRAEAAVLDADLVIIFGTDHYGGLGTITLTEQAYATPFGILPKDEALVANLAESWGPQAAFADELHHIHEHSIELSAVWLHHLFNKAGKEPCPMVPILVGSFQQYLTNSDRPETDERLAAFLEALQKETAGRRVVAVASVDLAHVGPSFGDSFVMDEARRETLSVLDQDLMRAAVNGDAEDWYSQIAAVNDKNRICGFSPTYLLLRYLGQTSGSQVAYDQCPADNQDTSLVSICGLLID